MTKKDYIIIAKALKEAREKDICKKHSGCFATIVLELEKVFIIDNLRFDELKFEKAIYQ